MINKPDFSKPGAIIFDIWMLIIFTLIFVGVNIIMFSMSDGNDWGLVQWFVLVVVLMQIPYAIYFGVVYATVVDIKEIWHYDKSKAIPPRPSLPPKPQSPSQYH